MTQQDSKSSPLDLDQIELHSDAAIDRGGVKPPRRRENRRRGRSWSGLVFFILFAAATAAAGYFYLETEKLTREYQELAVRVEDTSTNLDTTVNNLQEAQSLIARMQTQLQDARGGMAKFEKQAKDLGSQLAAKDKALEQRKQDADQANRQLKNAQAQRDNLRNERNKLRNDLAASRKDASQKIADLEQRIEQARLQYQAELDDQNKAQATIRMERDRAIQEKERIERQFQEESQASLQIIREGAELKRDNESYQRQINKLNADLKQARGRIARLQTLETGDLVPYSDEITPAKVNYREPLPDGVKIPRRIGSVALQTLINEVGSVEKAFIAPDQAMEGPLAKALVENVYRWKFSPPTLNGVRVKTWQTVIIGSQ